MSGNGPTCQPTHLDGVAFSGLSFPCGKTSNELRAQPTGSVTHCDRRRRPMSVDAGVALAVADAVWEQIKAAGHATDEHLSILEHLFGKNMLRACKILDEGGVRRVTGAPSGRLLFLVMGESKRKEEYICFPEHLCTCYSFFYDIVGRGEQLCCKHQLAARLAEAVGQHQEMEVTDEELAHMLAKL
uniref:Uncharacterized protein n=1 Tax=Avena sativa TaxID=4498 RepID=A0ACD5ULR0_AVESA